MFENDEANMDLDGVLCWKRYRPCYIRAFNDAKDIAKQVELKNSAAAFAGSKSTTDDYVTATEFRLLCAYLCIYACMFEAFSMIDGKVGGDINDDDRRISMEEFATNYPQIRGNFGFAGFAAAPKTQEERESLFKSVDKNGGGFILLDEWCKYLENAEIEANTSMGDALKVGD